MSQVQQSDLFDSGCATDGGSKEFSAKGGLKVRYLRIDSKTMRLDIGVGETCKATLQSQDRWYTVLPKHGQVQERGIKTFLGKVALAMQVLSSSAREEAAEAKAARAMEDAAEARRQHREVSKQLAEAVLSADRRQHGGGGCKAYHGHSPFKEYGPKINPHAEAFSYSKGFHWLRKAHLRPEWKAVYEHCANEARGDGACRAGVLSIAAGTNLSKNGVKAALTGLAEYRLISVKDGKGGNDSRTIYFHRHEWMEWMEDTGPRRDPVPGHGATSTGSRLDPHKEEKKQKNFSATDSPNTPADVVHGEKDSLGPKEENGNPLRVLTYEC